MKSLPLLVAALAVNLPLAALPAEAPIRALHATAQPFRAVPRQVAPGALRPLGLAPRRHDDVRALPEMPAPPHAAVHAEPLSATTAGLPPLPLSPAPKNSFSALIDDGTSIPPDTQGAVSPTQLIVAANTQVRVQTRSGSQLGIYSLDSFFGSVDGGSGVFDPVIQYDPYAQRFVFVAADDAETGNSALLVSASQGSDANGSYWAYRIDADATGTYWADRPQLGFNKDWIVVQMNLFKVSDGSFGHSVVYVLPKAGVYAGSNINYSLFNLDASFGGGQVPAQTLDSSASTLYLVQRWNGNSSGNGYIRLYSLTGAVGNETMAPVGYMSTTATWASKGAGGADFAPQAGSSHFLDSGDDRMLSVLYRGGSVWAAQTVFLPADAPTRSAVQWWNVSTTASVLQRGRIDDPSGVLYAAYPSIAVNKDGAAIVGYSTFSGSQYASAAYAIRTASDPSGALQSPVTFKTGEAPYYKTFSGTQNRWGDYSASVVDPANDTDFWTVQEYAATPSGGKDRWGMWWANVTPATAPSSTCTADGTTLCLTSGRFKVQADYRDYGGNTGHGNAVALTGDSGYFWFFAQSNVELVAKMVSFCSGSSGNYGLYASGLTDVEVTFKVTDTKTGFYKEYHNALGNRFCTIADGPYTCP